jgi:hypothetical protein
LEFDDVINVGIGLADDIDIEELFESNQKEKKNKKIFNYF